LTTRRRNVSGWHLRARVHGRSDDVLHYSEVVVHPLVVRTVMAAHSAVLDYQVQQTVRGAAVSVIVERALDIDELRNDLAVALARAGPTMPA
jgi:phenylacetate-coenzyme A ligase PaaK-like adenylate-forming protein